MKRYSLLLIFSLVLLAFGATATTHLVLGKQYHKQAVKKGDSLYGLSKLYGWNYDTLTNLNPSIAENLQAGQTVWYPIDNSKTCVDSNSKPSYDTIEYIVKYGETLYDISKQCGISVSDIFKLNPEITERNITGGCKLKIIKDLKVRNAKITYDTIERVKSFIQYKIKKDDTLFGIAYKNHVSLNLLNEVNGFSIDNTTLKKGEYISIPVVESVITKHYEYSDDPREMTPSGRVEIYNSIFNKEALDKELQIILLLSVNSNMRRDAEFLKGFILSMNNLKDSEKKINLKVFDVSSNSIEIEKLIAENKLDSADVIISTEDQKFPQIINDFGKEKGIYIINSFCLVDTAYQSNNYAVQILPPTLMFNETVSDGLIDEFSEHTFLFLENENEESDEESIENLLMRKLSSGNRKFKIIPNINALDEVEFKDGDRYLICSNAKKNTEIETVLKTVADLQSQHPLCDFSVFGRPNWIVNIEKFQAEMGKVNTYIPSQILR